MNTPEYQETYKTCPYNSAHKILSHRFTTHLVKCRRQYPNEAKVACKFNASHIVAKQELAMHMETCPDRNQIDNMSVETTDGARKITIDYSSDRRVNLDWDEDTGPAYNPKDYVMNKPILRRIDTASKAQRREFNEQERLRFQKFTDSSSSRQEEPKRQRFPAQPPASNSPRPLSEILNEISKHPKW